MELRYLIPERRWSFEDSLNYSKVKRSEEKRLDFHIPLSIRTSDLPIRLSHGLYHELTGDPAMLFC
jgi:hypothetical protein